MTTQQVQMTTEQRARAMNIIWFAMILGVVVFAVIAGVKGQDQQPQGDMLLTMVGMGMAACMFVVSLIVPNIVANQQFRAALQRGRYETDEEKQQAMNDLESVFMTKFLIGMALLEGGAFMNLVFYIVEGQILAMIPVAILVALMIASKPSQAKLEAWIRNQMENYNLENQN
jgi:MFS family permease